MYVKLYRFWESLPKSKRPSCKSYQTVLSATKDLLTLAKFHFFAHIANILQSFLTICQYAKPMTLFIYDDLYQLLKDFTSKFMKKEVLDRCKNSSSLCKLDFHLKQNQLKHPDHEFGADTLSITYHK